MLRFAIKLLLFSGIFFIYDKVFLIVADLSARAEADKRLEYLINGEINKDIIVIGSSTGSRDIIAEQMEKKTGLSAYNLCYPGSNVEFHEFILRTLIKFNTPPKILLLIVDDDAELRYDSTILFRNDRLYPLVKYSVIRKELIDRGEKDRFLSKILVLHNLNKANFDLRRKVFTPVDTIFSSGSMPVSWKRQWMNWDYIYSDRPYHENKEIASKVAAYREIIKTTEINNIKLVVVFPPVYKTHSRSFENRIRQLSGEKAYYYVYNNDNQIYRNKDYYFDDSHLLKLAAVIFTDELSDFLIKSVI